MRIYISGKITGTDDYMQRFERAQKELEKEGHSVINPAEVNSKLPKDTTYEEYMKMSLTMLDMCKGIYMLQGWEDSRGANVEYIEAVMRGMQVYKLIIAMDECDMCPMDNEELLNSLDEW